MQNIMFDLSELSNSEYNKSFFVGGPVEFDGKKVGTVTNVECGMVYCEIADEALKSLEGNEPCYSMGVAYPDKN